MASERQINSTWTAGCQNYQTDQMLDPMYVMFIILDIYYLFTMIYHFSFFYKMLFNDCLCKYNIIFSEYCIAVARMKIKSVLF